MNRRLGVLVSVLALSGAGCKVNPFCLDCVDADTQQNVDGGLSDGFIITGDGSVCLPTGPEVCNGIDDDCNGEIDDGVLPQIGDTCSANIGICKAGKYVCNAGKLECGEGGSGPQAEQCNGIDDDCDGVIDNGNPGGGVLCGSGVGSCKQGITACVSGAIECQGNVGPSAELCDGHDNDCNGDIDDGDPGGGPDCGAGPGVCVLGKLHCLGGRVQCIGAGPPIDELCNNVDDNCNGAIDEGFNTAVDVDNCGTCGNKCALDFATPTCSAGVCEVLRCDPDHWDIDKDPTNGCEYACVKTGVELCNGKDDDCNKMIDDALPPAPAICATQGQCAGTNASCDGLAGWVCHYGTTVSTNSQGQIVPETNCDNLDNDCNNKIDDLFPQRGLKCTRGLGVCTTSGTQICNSTKDALVCTAATPPAGTAEVCNGLDDDCNGILDDNAPDAYVTVSGPSGPLQIYQFEASRPDSTHGAVGTLSHRSCSATDRLPWVNVTYPQAVAACTAAGARLCTEAEWQAACEAGSGCDYAYGASCDTYVADTCNDNKHDIDAGPPIHNAALPTQSLAACYANWSTAGKVYDLSGNVKEWTTARSAGVNPLRGGSFTNPPGGTRCDENFTLGDDTFLFANVGFRCCK